MNASFLIVVMLAGLAVIYFLVFLLQSSYTLLSKKVYTVLAGDEDGHPLHHDRVETLKPFESFRIDGKRIDPSKYILARVEGECMHPRGIHSGNLVFIHALSEQEKKSLKDNSILYIKVTNNDSENYYLREYVKERSNDTVVATRFYRNGIELKESEPHHKIENVVGVVRYCFE